MKRNIRFGIFIITIISLFSYPAYSPAKNTTPFKEKIFKSLKWGMSESDFLNHYPRSNEVVMTPPPKPMDSYYQDIDLVLYGHSTKTGFNFGAGGLNQIIVSLPLSRLGKAFNKVDFLKLSNNIYDKLDKNYAGRRVSHPWNGKNFMHIWIVNDTIVMLAWDGGNSWGIQYRSIEHDSQAEKLHNRLVKEGALK